MKSFIAIFCVLLVASSSLAAPQFMPSQQFPGGFNQNYGMNPYNNGMGRMGPSYPTTHPGYNGGFNGYQGGYPGGYGAAPYGVDERIDWLKLGQ